MPNPFNQSDHEDAARERMDEQRVATSCPRLRSKAMFATKTYTHKSFGLGFSISAQQAKDDVPFDQLRKAWARARWYSQYRTDRYLRRTFSEHTDIRFVQPGRGTQRIGRSPGPPLPLPE
jgi:hypothetical protein